MIAFHDSATFYLQINKHASTRTYKQIPHIGNMSMEENT